MALKTKPWDIQDHITSAERQAGLLEAAFEDGDAALIAAAFRDIATARGIPAIGEGDPALSTIMGVMKALGLRLRAEPAEAPPLEAEALT